MALELADKQINVNAGIEINLDVFRARHAGGSGFGRGAQPEQHSRWRSRPAQEVARAVPFLATERHDRHDLALDGGYTAN